MPDVTAGELTIDQLAAEVDMTVRNIRAHQARGLLPPPTIRGRIGYYGPLHVRRLQQIRAMQDEGLNLAAIAKVVNDGRLTELTTEVFTESGPLWLDPGELLERLGAAPDDGVTERALELGLIEIDGDRVRMDVPRLLPLAEEFLAMGVPLAARGNGVHQLAREDWQQEIGQRRRHHRDDDHGELTRLLAPIAELVGI